MFVGLALWVAGLLVLFYMPAANRWGHQGMFEGIVIVLGALGAVLMGRGWKMRKGG
jgi:phosphatidylserine synthase